MKLAAAIFVTGLAMLLTGCLFRGTPKATQAAVPVAPRPATAPTPAPAPQPLSIQQPHPELPPPQPISADALATTELQPEEPPRAPAPPKPTRARASQPPKTETPAPPPAAAPAEPQERPPIQEIIQPEELRELQANAQHDRKEAQNVLDHITHALNHHQQAVRRSIESYLSLSTDAERRGDLRQARELAGRAAVLAKDLQP